VGHIIHTVGPIYRAPRDWGALGEPRGVNTGGSSSESATLLEKCYRNCLRIANEERLKTLAFPAISCGVYHYPLDDAAEVALEAVRAHAGSLKEVHFVLFGEDTFSAWEKTARAMNLVEEIMTD